MSKYTVWGICDHPDWLRENDGTPDMPLSLPLAEDTAHKHARGLSMMAPAGTFEVRDAFGTVVKTYGPERKEQARPVPASHRARRSLGGRGR